MNKLVAVAILAGGALLLVWLKTRKSTPPHWYHHLKGYRRD